MATTPHLQMSRQLIFLWQRHIEQRLANPRTKATAVSRGPLRRGLLTGSRARLRPDTGARIRYRTQCATEQQPARVDAAERD
jgi:hypothetical protein